MAKGGGVSHSTSLTSSLSFSAHSALDTLTLNRATHSKLRVFAVLLLLPVIILLQIFPLLILSFKSLFKCHVIEETISDDPSLSLSSSTVLVS